MASASGVAGPSLTAGTARSFIRVRLAAGLPIRWPYHVLSIRTLAWLTRSRGARRGANDHRREATPGHIQPLSLRRNGTSGYAGRRQAVFRECLLSSRSRVRVAVGAQVRGLVPPSADAVPGRHAGDAPGGFSRFQVLRVARHRAVERYVAVHALDGDVRRINERIEQEFLFHRFAISLFFPICT